MKHNPRFWLEAYCTRTCLRTDTDDDGVSDAWEDSDGDGVFNIQELMIGKNPGDRDIVGIELRVAIDFCASTCYLEHLKEAIKLAMQYIYDYTDGYVFISNVTIVNNVPKNELREYNLIVRWTNVFQGRGVPGYAGIKFYDGEIGTISISGKILTPETPWYSDKDISYRIKWLAAVIGHEFAHAALRCYHECSGLFICDSKVKWIGYDDLKPQIKQKLSSILVYAPDGPRIGISCVMGFYDPPADMEIYVRELSWYGAYATLTSILESLGFEYGMEYTYGGETGHLYANITEHWYQRPTGLKYGFQWYTTLYWLSEMMNIAVSLWFIGDQCVVFTGLHDYVKEYVPLGGPFNIVFWYTTFKVIP